VRNSNAASGRGYTFFLTAVFEFPKLVRKEEMIEVPAWAKFSSILQDVTTPIMPVKASKRASVLNLCTAKGQRMPSVRLTWAVSEIAVSDWQDGKRRKKLVRTGRMGMRFSIGRSRVLIGRGEGEDIMSQSKSQ
jgi:hypothetical protein